MVLPFQEGQQINGMTKQPYYPGRLDPRFGYPTNTPLTKSGGFEKIHIGKSNIMGIDALSENHTTTALLGKTALESLNRLILNVDEKPFSLSVHFNNPYVISPSSRPHLCCG